MQIYFLFAYEFPCEPLMYMFQLHRLLLYIIVKETYSYFEAYLIYLFLHDL